MAENLIREEPGGKNLRETPVSFLCHFSRKGFPFHPPQNRRY